MKSKSQKKISLPVSFAVGAIAAALLLLCLGAANPNPWWRNPYTTNQYPVPVTGPLYFSGGEVVASIGTAFYGNGAGLTNELFATNGFQFVNLDQLSAFSSAGEIFYFYGSSNAVGLNLASGSTNWALPTPSPAGTVLSTYTSVNDGDYLMTAVSTRTFLSIAEGQGQCEVYAYKGAPGACAITAEIYLHNVDADVEELEYEPAPAYQTITTSPTKYTFSIPLTNYTTTSNLYVVVKIKASVSSGTPTVYIQTEGSTASHMSFPVPLSSFMYKGGDSYFAGGTTNDFNGFWGNGEGLTNLTWKLYKDFWVDAGAMRGSTNPATIGASTNGASAIVIDTWDFDDTVDESVQFKLTMPDAWRGNGYLKIKLYSTTSEASGTWRWLVASSAASHDEIWYPNMSTSYYYTNTVTAAEDLLVTSGADIGVASSPVLGDLILFNITRDVGAWDTVAGDMRLLGVSLQYMELQTSPAEW